MFYSFQINITPQPYVLHKYYISIVYYSSLQVIHFCILNCNCAVTVRHQANILGLVD